jgi:hypothetical protein
MGRVGQSMSGGLNAAAARAMRRGLRWFDVAQANRAEAREVERWVAYTSTTPAVALAVAEAHRMRPSEAARLVAAEGRLTQLALAVDQAATRGDGNALKSARRAYDAAVTHVVLASRAADASSLAGVRGALGAPHEPQPRVGRVPHAAVPEQIADTLRHDPAFQRAYPDAQVQVVNAKLVRVSFTSQGAQRTMLVGSFRDIERFNPAAARQAGAYLTQRSSLYFGRSAEYAGTSFRMADMTSLVLDDKGDLIGSGTLTYQTGVYGRQQAQGGGRTAVQDPQQRQVLFLAQVAGELGGGRQAVDPLLAFGRQSRTNIVATTFPLNFQDAIGANGEVTKRALYGTADAAMRDGGGTDPDFAALWRVRGPYPQDRPYYFGPGQPNATHANGQSIFNGLPREPDPGNPQDVRTHDRIFYGWINEGSKDDAANIPLYVHSDNRLAGEIPARDTSKATRSYWIPLPQPTKPATVPPTPTDLPQVRSADDLRPRLPPDMALPSSLSPSIDELPAEAREQAAEISEQTGSAFLQRLDNGRVAAVQHVKGTWRPIAEFTREVGDNIQSGAVSWWDNLPQPVRSTARTSGVVLGAAVDPVGTAFKAGVAGFQRVLDTPAGRPVLRFFEARAADGQRVWNQLAQHPQGKHLVGIWDNTFGHPQFGAVANNLTTGAGRAMQVVTNGGLGLLATGVINGQTKIGSFTAGDPKQMLPELAQVYRQIANVPRGMTINYATVPIPDTPNGRVTVWSAGGMYSFLRPSAPWAPQPGTTQLSNALNRTQSGKLELNTWASVVANGPTAYSGIAVNLTDNIGVQRSAYASLGSSLTQPLLLRSGAVDRDPLIAGRQTPWFDPKLVSSLGAVRIGITDEVRFPVRVGDKEIGLNVQINRLRTPIRATAAGTLINQGANGTFGLRPDGQFDPTRPSAVRSLTVFGTYAGFNPEADDLEQLRQIGGFDDEPPALPPQRP